MGDPAADEYFMCFFQTFLFIITRIQKDITAAAVDADDENDGTNIF